MKNRKYSLLSASRLFVALILVSLLVACERTEYKDIWADCYVEPKLDTIEIKNNWYLAEPMLCTADSFDSQKDFVPFNLFLDGDNLYVANQKGKCVDVFDAKTMKYKNSLEHDGRTVAHDVYVNGEHIFVATGEMCAIQIFDKASGKYLTRLGTGGYGGNVSKSGCVAANEDFVFVRDSKEQNIRVFERKAISVDKTDNNTVFARLDTKGFFINSGAEPLNHSYDMEIIGDSLYVFLHVQGQIYAYSLDEVKQNAVVFPSKTSLPAGEKVFAAVPDNKNNTVCISMDVDGKRMLIEVSQDDFFNRAFNAPLRSFISDNRHIFPEQPMIAFNDEMLFFVSRKSVERWKIANKPFYVITPLK